MRHRMTNPLQGVATESRPPTAGLAWIYGLVHALVDACCVTVVFRAIGVHDLSPHDAFAIVLAYDVIAFGSQVVFGWLTDRAGAPRAALCCGIGATALGALALPLNAWAAMVLVGLGNALYHLGAGAFVLRLSPQEAAAAGVFVAPGALGLALGIYLGKNPAAFPLWPFPVLLIASLGVALLVRNPPFSPSPSPPSLPIPRARATWLVALLLVSVAVRSFVGMGGTHALPRSTIVLFAIPLAAFAGKALGGLLSDRLGWLETSVGALLLSAPLIASGGTRAWLLIPGLLLFQMTMPVTLSAVSLVMPGRTAMAFGWTTLALILGALPTFFPWGKALYHPATFLVLAAGSAAAMFVALRWLGGRDRRNELAALTARVEEASPPALVHGTPAI